ncbi:MAG: DsrE family protein [Reyranella sp.]|nr:DsrE family protein [Reyranella sp.]
MRKVLASIVASICFWSLSAGAQSTADKAALEGLKELKIIFDITNGDAKGLSGTLNVIEETRQSLINQGVVPQIILSFRGPATKLLQTDKNLISEGDRQYAGKIAEAIATLRSAKGIAGIEQCGIAARNQEVKPENVFPGVRVVGNGWISLAAYQAKGYAYIAP